MDLLKNIVVALITFLLCVAYVIFVMKTQKIKEKRKAVVLLLGLLIEISLGICVGYFVNRGDPPPHKEITTEASIESNNDINIEIINNNNNYNNNENYQESISSNYLSESKPYECTLVQTTTEQTTKNPTIFLSFEPLPYSLTDNNGDFRAYTSFEAQKVTLYCEVDGVPYGEFNMKTDDLHSWTYDACFFEPNTYVLTAVAEGPTGKVYSNPVPVTYPF